MLEVAEEAEGAEAGAEAEEALFFYGRHQDHHHQTDRIRNRCRTSLGNPRQIYR
jgi:hypothetical protein